MSNIIDSIRLSGTTYQIQGSGGGITVDPTLDSGSTNPVANSAITTALGDKVNVADNNASAYTFENKIGRAEYSYSEQFAGPIYIRYTGSLSLSGSYYAGRILCYSESAIENISLYFNLSDGQITATTVSSVYFDIEIENGEAALTFKNGYYLRQYISQNGFVALTKTTYESGQSANVIEDTVYDVFDKLNDKIDKTDDNAVTGNSINFSNGYLESHLHTNKTTLFSSTKIDSSTIKSSINDGLSVQFATHEAVDKILNVGSGSYGTLFSTSSYDTSINEFTITFNPNCTQYSVYEFSVQVKDASNVGYGGIFEYNSSDMSAEYTDLSTYCTVTDTLSTDYKLKVTAKEGYKIARLYNSNYMVGGVDNTNPNNYISNLVTTPSYVHDGQDVIDDIYDKLDDKQDTLVSSQNIKTINNESILGSGNIDIQGGGKAVSGGTNISVTTGETADTINCTLPYYRLDDNENYSIYGQSNKSFINKASYAYQTTFIGSNNKVNGDSSSKKYYSNIVIGYQNIINAHISDYLKGFNVVIGNENILSGTNLSDSYVIGKSNSGYTSNTLLTGWYNQAYNNSESTFGKYNASNTGSTDADKSLFSVGNGTADNARHNAFEIRQNGDIYLTLDGQDVKLQDHLGGGSSYTAGDGIDITNDVISVTGKVDTTTYNTYTAATDTALASKQTTLTAGTGIDITDNVISATGGGGGGTVESAITSGSTNAVESKAIWSATTFNKGVLLTFNDSESTNYPEGCTKLIVEVAGFDNSSNIDFFNDDEHLGGIHIDNRGDVINVNVRFDGATYEIDGTTVIISYPSTDVTYVQVVGETGWTYTAVVEGAWVNENTYMKPEVDAIASGLQNNINSKLDATAYTPTVVDSALNVASTNPVQNQALYSELRINNGEAETTLTFENDESTNYPNGCTKLIVEVVGSNNMSDINFFNDDEHLGGIHIDNQGDVINVIVRFDGASYEISGTSVIITYPTVTSVTKIRVDGIGNYVYKAITSLTTPLKDKVAANTTALGGLSLIKLTQAEYDALSPNYDSNTLYVIVN